MTQLTGIFPALVTPFQPDGALDLAGLQANLTRHQTEGLAGYLVLGSTGEVVHLDEVEKFTILETARAAISSNRSMIVGTGLHSTSATIEFTRRAAQLGADYALVVTPHYFKSAMTQPVLADYYRAVADASPIPVLLYSVPQFTGVTLQPETAAKLAEHENIVGIKDSSGDMRALAQLLSLVDKDFAVLTGSAPVLAPALMMGAAGAILAVANFVAPLCVEIFQQIQQHQYQTARDRQLQLLALSEQIASRYGVGGIKYAMQRLGYSGGQVRSPLAMPERTAQQSIDAILQQAGSLAN